MSAPGDVYSTGTPAAIRRDITVGVLAPLTGGFYWGEIIAGIVRAVTAAGGRVALIQTLDAGQTAAAFLPIVGAIEPVGWDHIDGFVAMLRATDDEYLRRVQRAGKPVVLAAYLNEDLDAASVTVDNTSGVHAAVEHLIGHGHTRIGFLGNDGHSDMRERYAAYREAMIENGLEPHALVLAPDDLEGGGFTAASTVAAAAPGWTAMIAATDRNALGLINGLREEGIAVPCDVAVIGFDDAEPSWHCDPPLSTVRQRFDDIGAAAAQVLLAEVSGNPPEHWRHTVPTTLVLRASCGCDPTVTRSSETLAEIADAMVAAVSAAVGIDPDRSDATGRPLAGLDMRLLDATIRDSVEQMLATGPGPEGFQSFLLQSIRRLNEIAVATKQAGLDGWDALEYAAARIASTLTHLESARSLSRINRLSVAYDEQYDIGMGLLGQGDDDPADLHWLARAGVRAGCLGLWNGPPADGQLVIAGAHDTEGRLQRHVGASCAVTAFPPRDLLDLADAPERVAYVIPVRGASGNHGLLCVVCSAEPEFAVTRSAQDHWAALLGESLREKRMLEDVRRSEERYAVAARASKDGLWEWSEAAGVHYLSGRCRELIGLAADDPIDTRSLRARIHPDDQSTVGEMVASAVSHLDSPVEVECRLRRDDGTTRWMHVRALGVARDGEGRGVVGSISDVDQRHKLEDQLRHAALFDELTGLPNRRLFLDRLRQAIEQRRRRKDLRFAVLFLDLDGFKLINDSLGHMAGDDLLQVVAERLRTELRAVDTAARFGGDEFAILLNEPVPEDLLVVADRIQRRLARPVVLGKHEVAVTATVGIATADTGYSDPEDVLRDADTAMYRAKETERGSACLFDPTMHQRALDRLRIRNNVAVAMDNNEFVVHYQPIVDVHDTTVAEFEALVRWQHPVRGLLGPAEFLPSMEGNSSILALGQHVLDEVCAQIADWDRAGGRRVSVSVNVSHREFWAPGFLPGIRETLARHNVPPESLSLELTETIIMTDPDEARAVLDELHSLGVGLSIDDFGTGHSSLHLLRTFPFDTLKIDGSFIRELTVVDETTALVRAIITMGEALGMAVVAECVETPAQAARLEELGCTTIQGWLYARAMPAKDAGQILGTPLHEAPASDRTPSAHRTLRTKTGPAGGGSARETPAAG